MDVTDYMSKAKAVKRDAALEYFDALDIDLKTSKPGTLDKIKDRFPLFFEAFRKELQGAEPVWLNTGKIGAKGFGSKGLLIDGIIFAPWNDGGGYRFMYIAQYCGRNTLVGYLKLLRAGEESGLAEHIKKIQADSNHEVIKESLKPWETKEVKMSAERKLTLNAAFARDAVLQSIESMFPDAYSLFEKDFETAPSAWLNVAKPDCRCGVPGIVVKGLIFAPYEYLGGHSKFVCVAIYNGLAEAECLDGVTEGDEDSLLESVRRLQDIRKRKLSPAKGGMSQGGLTKLIEEAGEVIQVAAKLQAYPSGDHPDGKGDLNTRLEEEIADLEAAIAFVKAEHGLAISAINARMVEKLETFKKWNTESQHKGGN